MAEESNADHKRGSPKSSSFQGRKVQEYPTFYVQFSSQRLGDDHFLKICLLKTYIYF